jgi:HlyD family secretion protein
VTATGTLSALVTVLVGSQVSGRIESIRADFNSSVKKGQIVATIEPSLFQAAVEQARANDAAARANVDKAKAQAMDAERQYNRAKQLGEQKLIAQADVDTAEANWNIAKAQLASSAAGVQQTAAALHQTQVNLKYATILSPIDGIVISRSVDVGQTVAASLQAPTLFTIAQDLTKMQVDTSVAEGDVGKISPGMRVTFSVDAYPGQRFEGSVRQVRDAAVTVQNVVTYDAVIDVDNSKRLLKPGMTATVTFTPAERADVLRVPNAALRYRPPAKPAGSAAPRAPGPPAPKDRRTVYRLSGNVAKPVDIQIGLTDGSVTEVVGGELREGDAVITESLSETTTAAPAAAPTRLPRGF